MHICQHIRSYIVLRNIKMNLIMWRYKHVIHIKQMVIFYITIFIMMVKILPYVKIFPTKLFLNFSILQQKLYSRYDNKQKLSRIKLQLS